MRCYYYNLTYITKYTLFFQRLEVVVKNTSFWIKCKKLILIYPYRL